MKKLSARKDGDCVSVGETGLVEEWEEGQKERNRSRKMERRTERKRQK